jgi:hypothetical protein
MYVPEHMLPAAPAGRTYGQQVEYERRQKELRDRGEID